MDNKNHESTSSSSHAHVLKDEGVPLNTGHLTQEQKNRLYNLDGQRPSYGLFQPDNRLAEAALSYIDAAKAAHEAAVLGAIDRRCIRGFFSNCADCPLDIDPKCCSNSPFYVCSAKEEEHACCGSSCDCSVNPQAKPGESFYGRAAKASEAQYIDPNGDYYKPWLESYPEGVPEFVDTHEFENLVELFENSISKYASNVAFVNMGSELTFKQIGEYADDFAAFLQVKLGLKKGEKIAIMMPNLMQFPIAFFGALKAGLTVININPLYTPRELRNQLENSDATSIVVIANYADSLEQIIDKTLVKNVILTEVGDAFNDWLGFKRLIINSAVRLKGMVPKVDKSKFAFSTSFTQALKKGRALLSKFEKPHIEYDDIALLQYTGGTTGKSKGAMLSHGNILANIAQAYGMYGQVLKLGKETILTVIPLYHIFALTVNLVLFTYLGSKNLLITDPRNLKAFSKDLKKHPEITAMTGVNTLFNLFINHEEFTSLKWDNLHLVVGGGAAVQSGVEQRFYEKTGFHILEGYGLTECSPLCSVCPFTVDHYTGSIGLIVPSTIARIVDSEGKEIRNMEQEGELEIKGPQVMHGYYKCDKHNDFIFDDGYVRTGDIAKWMEGGYIKLIDRLKDMILVSGFNVFPNEIEDIVSRFNRVLECAVIGIPSDNTGEAVKIFVVKKDPSLTAQEIKQYCRAYLTPYKVPRVIQFVDSLPKSPLGKVLRRKLRDMEGKVPLTAEQQLEQIKLQEQQQLAELKTQQERMKAYAQDQAQSHKEQAVASLIDTGDIEQQGKGHFFTSGFGLFHSQGYKLSDNQSYKQKTGAQDTSAMLNAVLHAFSSHTASGTTHKTDYRYYERTLEEQKSRLDNSYGMTINKDQADTTGHVMDYGVQTNANLGLENSTNELSKEQWQRLEEALHARHVPEDQEELANKHIKFEQVEAAQDSSTQNDSEPAKKSKGAMALERLLSSHGIDDLDAATTTPNIHRKSKKSSLVRGPESSRIHVGNASHDQKLDK